MSKSKSGGLDQYGAGPFEQQQFGTAGVEGVNGVSDSTKMSSSNLLQICCRCIENKRNKYTAKMPILCY